jgi:hypothetical protein
MFRVLLCTVVAIPLVTSAALAEAKKTKRYGKFVSFTKGKNAGTLKITLAEGGGKTEGEEKLQDKEFQIKNGTPVTINGEDCKLVKGSSPAAFYKIKKGIQVVVYFEDGKVVRVFIGNL